MISQAMRKRTPLCEMTTIAILAARILKKNQKAPRFFRLR